MPALKTRLTETVKAGGCASKLSPAILDKVLGKLPRQHDPNVLVGFDHADDAGIYKIAPNLALVQTVDFFTPIVDDPYAFGQIAATNALSDVYAMGGRPITALAHVCFPANGDLEVLEQILAGGLSKMIEASCTVVGGHSIRDEETKFGYSVTGLIDPSRIFTNGGAQPGDRLVFTKSLGTGVISTAIKQGTAKQSWIDAATRSMTTLNKAAAEIIAAKDCVGPGLRPGQAEQSSAALVEQPPANERPIHSLTDVTGFGLIGHGTELAAASGVTLVIEAGRVPLFNGVRAIAATNRSGGMLSNQEHYARGVHADPRVDPIVMSLFYDPQTSGGLLVAASAGSADSVEAALTGAGVKAARIGRAKPQSGGMLIEIVV